MKKSTTWLGLLALLGLSLLILAWTAPVSAWDRGKAELFAVLPEGAAGPEGITVGHDGKVYVTTFGFNAAGEVAGPGKLYVFNDDGRLLRQVSISGSTSHLTGLAFHPFTHVLLVIDFAGAKVLQVDPNTGLSTPFMTAPTPPGSTGLNALTFDRLGNVYVSDSVQGIIWIIGQSGGPATAWVTDPKLATTNALRLGANGLGFNRAGNALFVANSGNHQIIKIPVTGGSPGTPTIYVNSINGADGLVLDRDDNIWVAANQADEIVVLDPTGKVIAKLGDFDGLTKKGVPKGLLSPASLEFSRDRDTLYVTNLGLDIRLFGIDQSIDSQWTGQIQRYTISKIRARIPSQGND